MRHIKPYGHAASKSKPCSCADCRSLNRKLTKLMRSAARRQGKEEVKSGIADHHATDPHMCVTCNRAPSEAGSLFCDKYCEGAALIVWTTEESEENESILAVA